MNNETLFTRIKKLVAIERRIGTEILECLYEIERRKAYAELRYDGLYTYCVKELGFSDSQAYQRIQAMRALKEVPELKPMIESGSLSVSAVSKVQTQLHRDRKGGKPRTRAEKVELFQMMENRTSREVEMKLAELRGEKLKEKLSLEFDEELSTLWSRVKNLAAHRSQGQSEEVLRILMKEWLVRHDPTLKESSATPRKIIKGATHSEALLKSKSPTNDNPTESIPKPQRTVPLSTGARNPSSVKGREASPSRNPARNPYDRYVPAALRKEIWRRDQGKCVRCASGYALEIDHIIPFALGGRTERDNLRLLCRSCNRFAAIRSFGVEKNHQPGIRCKKSQYLYQ